MTNSPTSVALRFQPIQPENIPDFLRPLSRWLGWKAGPPKSNGKFDKFPVSLSTGRKINGREPNHWQTFKEVMAAYQNGRVDGVGFALSDEHPVVLDGLEFFVTVADFDHCSAKMSEIHALWLELGKPFTELSPSSRGLHMWGLSRLPLKGGNAGNGHELYSGGRFVTMTGIGAKGSFGECQGFVNLERQWFRPRTIFADAPGEPPVAVEGGVSGNLVSASLSNHWFNLLSPDDKNGCLEAMLRLPAIIALADTPDDAPSPNWRTIVAACVRSGAPDAYTLCRTWAQTSARFDADNFDVRWGSYARG